VRIAFDIGGVLSKQPDIFRPLVYALLQTERASGYLVRVFVISDMRPHAKAVAFCHDNGFMVPPERIICADYDTHGENCKAVVCEELSIDVLVDDFPGYVAQIGSPRVRLLVMPDPSQPYYADDWKTDGSEGNFGRRKLAPAGGAGEGG
jgi:hypothetical protein